MIPQFPLKNSKGHSVAFDIQRWGAYESYDSVKAHRHHFYEILVFEQGTATHDIDFMTLEARRGTVHFVASDNVHLLLRSERSKGFSILFVDNYFPFTLLSHLPFNTTHPAVELDRSSMMTLTALAAQLQAEVHEPQPYSDVIIRGIMDAVMHLLLRLYEQQSGNATVSSLPPVLVDFRRLVSEHYSEHYRVEDYARLLHITPKHLIQLHKKHTGKTPLRYIQEQLTGISKRLLYDSSRTIKEIAYDLNFPDAATFSKYFKSVTGYSPLAYRQAGGK